ncbi:MAG TPA: hypothetical protein VE620_11915 [Myxococcales bacterium]|jgi:hypothetical protein|nr:hypothetical protein [Myxococcales bacterium]
MRAYRSVRRVWRGHFEATKGGSHEFAQNRGNADRCRFAGRRRSGRGAGHQQWKQRHRQQRFVFGRHGPVKFDRHELVDRLVDGHEYDGLGHVLVRDRLEHDGNDGPFAARGTQRQADQPPIVRVEPPVRLVEQRHVEQWLDGQLFDRVGHRHLEQR